MKKLAWYHELGFYSNPFSIKPAAFDNELMGYGGVVEDIRKKVAASGIILIYGRYGSGKTTILKKILSEFRGKKKVIYFNCEQSDGNIDFDRLLIDAGGIFRKIFRIRKKGMIMLLDEAQGMGKKDMKRAKEYYEGGFFKSMIFVSKAEKEVKLSKDMKEMMGESRFEMGNLSSKDAINLVRKRVGNLRFLSDDSIVKIYRKNPNPRAFLKNCEDVCRSAFESGSGKITDRIIKKAVR